MTAFFERKQSELGVALNDIQKQAVLHTEGAVLLLASPGSGKTTTIIMRIGYLIEEKGVDDPDVERRTTRILWLARVELVILFLVIFDMVVKPGL